MKINPNWTEVIDNSIDVPDELMPLFNKVGMQIRFMTLSGKNEIEAIAHIMEISRKFFSNNKHLLEYGKDTTNF